MAAAIARTREDVRRDLAAKLEEHRLDRGLSDASFAALLGVSRPFWSNFRRGVEQATPDILLGIATEFPDLRPLVAEGKPFCRGAEAFAGLAKLGI
jgi:transcriptional regulator with XRE-family HTH domain